MVDDPGYLPRLPDARLASLLSELPAVMVTGPRAAGKTTSARRLAADILGAVKRAVDADPRPGRFLLTGSVEADLTARMWPGTGRVVRLVLRGLTQREIVGSAGGAGLLPTVVRGELDTVRVPDEAVGLAAAGALGPVALGARRCGVAGAVHRVDRADVAVDPCRVVSTALTTRPPCRACEPPRLTAPTRTAGGRCSP